MGIPTVQGLGSLYLQAGAQTSIIQMLFYFEHAAEPMAEFLRILAEQYDYPQLVEELIRDLGERTFNANDSKGPKSVATFLTKLSENLPKIVLKQMTSVIVHIDSEVNFQ